MELNGSDQLEVACAILGLLVIKNGGMIQLHADENDMIHRGTLSVTTKDNVITIQWIDAGKIN